MSETVHPLRTVGSLSAAEFSARLADGSLGVRIGPFDIAIAADVRGLNSPLQWLYRDYPLLEHQQEFSFHVRMRDVWHLLSRPKRQVRFIVDGRAPHADMPADQSLAVLEWGINLVIALRYHCFLMLHAAVVERNGFALALPATPGSGKTTLCAALVHRGWRLLSDEFGLVRPGTIEFVPVPRPMPLKNESMQVIRSFAPQAELGPLIPGTRKGDIAHLRPPTASIEAAQKTATAKWLVFPRWSAGADYMLEEIPRGEGFMALATNAFNYEMLGKAGFQTASDLIAHSRSFTLQYSDLDQAVAGLNQLADS